MYPSATHLAIQSIFCQLRLAMAKIQGDRGHRDRQRRRLRGVCTSLYGKDGQCPLLRLPFSCVKWWVLGIIVSADCTSGQLQLALFILPGKRCPPRNLTSQAPDPSATTDNREGELRTSGLVQAPCSGCVVIRILAHRDRAALVNIGKCCMGAGRLSALTAALDMCALLVIQKYFLLRGVYIPPCSLLPRGQCWKLSSHKLVTLHLAKVSPVPLSPGSNCHPP